MGYLRHNKRFKTRDSPLLRTIPAHTVDDTAVGMGILHWRGLYVIVCGLWWISAGRFLSASSSRPIIFLSFLLSLSSWRWENHRVEAIPILCLHLKVAKVGKGIELWHWIMSFLPWEADTGRNRQPVPYLVPSAPTPVKLNTAIDSVDAQPQHTVLFPSHRGYHVTGTDPQWLLVTLSLVTTC